MPQPNNLVRFDYQWSFMMSQYAVITDMQYIDSERTSTTALWDRVRSILDEFSISLNYSLAYPGDIEKLIALEAFYYMDANL